jgi:hypothetical protein
VRLEGLGQLVVENETDYVINGAIFFVFRVGADCNSRRSPEQYIAE